MAKGKNKSRLKLARMICFPIIAFFVVLIIVVDIAAGLLADLITPLICPPIVDSQAVEQASTQGEALAAEVMQEGVVLVKNDNVLPLSMDKNDVNVFGWGSSPAGWVAGGSGSGRVMSVKNDNHYAETTLVSALNNYKVHTNEALTNYYTSYYNERPGIVAGTLNTSVEDFYKLVEPSIDEYPQSVKSTAESYSDTAFVVISRIAGEAKDPPRVQYKHNKPTDESRTYLEISQEEEGLLKYVGETFENVIVIINSTNTMELGFLDTIPGLDACLIVGGTGINAANALPAVIYGDVAPSGRLADTYAYEFESNVNYYNTGLEGEGRYTNGDNLLLVGTDQNAGSADRHGRSYVDYIENIYVGYKWYETADAEGIWNEASRNGKTGFEAVVQYPFGYGLSYVDKDDIVWNVKEVSPAPGSTLVSTDTIEITVDVTNNGQMAVKDVLELYYTPKYNEGGIEKSHVNLGDFEKTVSIEPGKTATVTLSLAVSDMKSYDAYDVNKNQHFGYELEDGEYQIKLMTDSHNLKTTTGITEDGIITYNVQAALFDTDGTVLSTPVNTNKFTGDQAYDGVSIDAEDEVQGGLAFVSRANFPQEAPQRTPDRAISDEAAKYTKYTEKMANDWDDASKDIFGNPVEKKAHTQSGGNLTLTTSNGNSATELGLKLGNDYDAEEWDSVISQVAYSDMLNFILTGTLNTTAIDSIGLPAINNFDGPAQIGGFTTANYRTTGFPNATVMAQTWNPSLILRFGTALATEGLAKGVKGWFGPGANIHRTPFGGRNYEYYSEDPYLSGIMAAYAMNGAKNAGVYGYLKHLALYEQESNREALYTWVSEQALREIYLRPFEIAVKSGACTGIMSSYNRIGAVWTGGSETLITGVLRNEWGFKGAVITDYSDNPDYMNMDQALRAGGSRFMRAMPDNAWAYNTTSERFQARADEGFKSYLYMYCNTFYQNQNPVNTDEATALTGTTPSWIWWIPALVCLNILIFAGAAIGVYILIRAGYNLRGATPEGDAPAGGDGVGSESAVLPVEDVSAGGDEGGFESAVSPEGEAAAESGTPDGKKKCFVCGIAGKCKSGLGTVASKCKSGFNAAVAKCKKLFKGKKTSEDVTSAEGDSGNAQTTQPSEGENTSVQTTDEEAK